LACFQQFPALGFPPEIRIFLIFLFVNAAGTMLA
jgi:hypothetical protein